MREINEKIVFYRCKNANNGDIVPFNYNIANSLMGFLELGVNTKGYFNVKDIYDEFQFGDILLDGIDQVAFILKKFNIVVPSINYPDCLLKYLGRKFWKDTINNINTNPSLWGNFVKPVRDKAFTGHIINGPKDLIGCGSCYEDYEVLVSQPVEFVYECRGFVYYDNLIDLRPYSGDFKYMKYMDTALIEKALEDFKTWEERPNVCSLDFGVIKDESGFKTVFIEMNSFSATGCYGLHHLNYAKMINAYFSSAYGIDDDCLF